MSETEKTDGIFISEKTNKAALDLCCEVLEKYTEDMNDDETRDAWKYVLQAFRLLILREYVGFVQFREDNPETK